MTMRVCANASRRNIWWSFKDTRTGRSIEIRATERTTSLLIAGKDWAGNLEQALIYKMDDETASRPMPSTCDDARSQ